MKRHKFDTLSFVSGVFITVVGLIFLLPAEASDLVDFFGGFDDLTSWFWPLAFLAVGALVLVPLLFRKSGQEDSDADESTEDATSTL